MKWCVFSDVHGNAAYLDALTEVWRSRAYGGYFFLGDAVGYFPAWREALRGIEALGAVCLLGNHDAMAVGILPIDPEKDEVYRLSEVRAALSEEERALFLFRKPKLTVELDGLTVMMTHGTPEDPLCGYGYEDSSGDAWDQAGIDFLFMGQTHRPWLRRGRYTMIVNAGSAGLPRDIGNAPSWATLDTRTRRATIERLELDLAETFPEKPAVHPSVWACVRRGTGDGGVE